MESKRARRNNTFEVASRRLATSMRWRTNQVVSCFGRRWAKQRTVLAWTCLISFAFCVAEAPAQDAVPSQQDSPAVAEPAPSSDALPVMFPHPQMDRLWLSGQVNIISQWHP